MTMDGKPAAPSAPVMVSIRLERTLATPLQLPQHRDPLASLGVEEETERSPKGVAHGRLELEEAIIAAKRAGGMVRSGRWPESTGALSRPTLLEITKIAKPGALPKPRPLSGVRVLDLTRFLQARPAPPSPTRRGLMKITRLLCPASCQDRHRTRQALRHLDLRAMAICNHGEL